MEGAWTWVLCPHDLSWWRYNGLETLMYLPALLVAPIDRARSGSNFIISVGALEWAEMTLLSPSQ